MKKKITIYEQNEYKEKEINYIPFRFILSMLLIILETVAVIVITMLCAVYIPYFYIAMYITEIYCVLKIINSEENPDYKIPWLLFVLIIPVAGFMIYFMFYDRKLSKKQQNRIKEIQNKQINIDESNILEQLKIENKNAYLGANLLCKIANTNLYQNTNMKYFDMGEKLFESMINDLKKAEKFIFLEYFIIEEGKMWNSILDILKEKVKETVEVRVIYDDIGCMCTLPGDYYKILKKYGINAIPFAKLRGQANNEFNNRSHRKIMVIDGKICYTGGVNIADEYINEINLYGIWKDVGIRLEGEAVNQLTSIFLSDYELNRKNKIQSFDEYFTSINKVKDNGYLIPFGDGPVPIYEKRVAKTMIMNMLNQAQNYVYMMSPYLIIDNDLCQAIENASLRGIDVRIITPHIPDKKIIFTMTRSYYRRLMDAGVKIYEYEPGFVHAKVYLSDDEYAIIGTINLDYRSLVHHFENGIWIYKHQVLNEIKNDIESTISKSIKMYYKDIPNNIIQRLIRSLVKIFSPML